MNSIQLHFIGVHRYSSVADVSSNSPCPGVAVGQRWDGGPEEGEDRTCEPRHRAVELAWRSVELG